MRLATVLVLIAVLSVLSIMTGNADFRITQVFSDSDTFHLLLVSRLPRTAAALLTGAALAVAGVIMQQLARNRFVEPSTAGTAQAAAIGILAVTMIAPSSTLFVRMIAATGTAMAGMAAFLILIRNLPPREPLLVPLVGLIYSGVLGAGVTFVAYQADLVQYVDVWMNGEFSGVIQGRYELLWIAGALAIAAYVVADQFTILGLGRDTAVNLGLNYRQVLMAGLVVVSMVTALVVVTVGMIPFVGLVVPNIVTRLMGDNLRKSLPVVALSGGALVLACDLVGRIVRQPYEVPVGTIFGVLGAGVFLWLLFARPPHAR